MFLINRLSELAPHLLIWFILVFLSLNIGLFFISKITKEISLVSIITSILVGYSFYSFYYYTIGMFSSYKEPFISAVPLLIGATFTLANKVNLQKLLKIIILRKNLTILLFSTFAILILFRAFPDLGFDSNWYHLSKPFYYLKQQKIFHIGGYMFNSGYPEFVEMLYIPQLKWGDSITTSIFSLFNYFLLGLVVYKLLIFLTNRQGISIIGMIGVLTTPVIVTYANVSYVDILQGLGFTLSLYWILQYIETSDNKNVILSAFMLIPVAGTKYSGGLICATLALFILFTKLYLTNKLKMILLLAIVAFFGLLPWLIKNHVHANNFLEPAGKISMFHYGSDAPTYTEYFKNINWLETIRALPGWTTFDYLTRISALIALVLLPRQQKWSYLVLLLGAMFVYRALPNGIHYRFYIPFIPITIILALVEISRLKNQALASSILIVMGFLVCIQIFYTITRVVPDAVYALGIKSSQEFKDHYYVKESYIVHDPTGHLNKTVGDKKLLVIGNDLIYPTIVNFNAEDYSFAKLDRTQIYSFKTLRNEMQKNGYSYFLTNRGNFQAHFKIWFEETESDRVEDFFDIVIYDRNAYGREWFLYRVK